MTPDLLLDQGQSAEVSSEEEQVMQTIYNILRQGYGPPRHCYPLVTGLVFFKQMSQYHDNIFLH